MTSMPASRNALAMILAPRSWPSRPGFAITTRIVPDTSAEYRGAPERHRLLSGLAEPRQRALGLHARGRRQPRLARLRPRRPGAAAGGAAFLASLGERLGFPDMFERTFHLSEYAPDTPFQVGKLAVTPTRVPHYLLETYAFRVQSNGAVLTYSGDSAPSQELVEAARGADLFVCEATLLRGELDGQPRGHLSLDEAVEAFEASGAKRLLVTHRPCELPTPDEYELAYDGLELEV